MIPAPKPCLAALAEREGHNNMNMVLGQSNLWNPTFSSSKLPSTDGFFPVARIHQVGKQSKNYYSNWNQSYAFQLANTLYYQTTMLYGSVLLKSIHNTGGMMYKHVSYLVSQEALSLFRIRLYMQCSHSEKPASKNRLWSYHLHIHIYKFSDPITENLTKHIVLPSWKDGTMGI